MCNLTINQAKLHLNGLKKLAVAENQFLSCVHSYLRNAETEVLPLVRADQFTTHVEIAELLDLQKRTEQQVEAFLLGGA